MPRTMLSVKGLKTYFDTVQGEVRAVDGVSFDIKKGETFALLGESGCGKSMTALSLMRLLPASGRNPGGEIFLDGVDVLKLSEVKMQKVRGGKVAMIFQEPMTSLNPVMSNGEQIAESVRLHKGLTGKAATEKVIELLEAVGIPDPQQRYKEYPHQLSGGMKQRVMIAIALAGDPELLIADEPTTALDVTVQAQILDLLNELKQKRGMAILMITHDLGVVSQMADRVGVMYAGQMIELAEREPFFKKPQHPYTQKLFESLPTMDKRDHQLSIISGQVPPLTQRFNGCRFVDRCGKSLPSCSSTLPVWQLLPEGNHVRCLLHEDQYEKEISAGQEQGANLSSSVLHKKEQDQEEILSVSGLKVHFPIHKGVFKKVAGYVYAVDKVDLSINKGETLALVGESGCGKTTVGKAILQLVNSTEGNVVFSGDNLSALKGEALRLRRSDFQIIFQDPFSSMNPRMMVSSIIEEGMVALGIITDRKALSDRVDELLIQVGLSPEMKHRYPHEFSGGQRQRICIARALAVNPKLIICDEPTSALDVSVQAQILNLLQGIQQELGITLLFITHNISVVAYFAHKVAVMYLGRIVEYGTVEEVLKAPKHPYTQALLSAVPTIDEETRQAVLKLEGDLPSPINPPLGCHFNPRCPQVMDQCKREYPESILVTETHKASCYLYGEKAS